MADERRRSDPVARHARLGRVARLATDQGGVVSRRQVHAMGITRSEVLSHVRAGRWRAVHSQGIAVHTGPLPQEGLFWAALFEAGDRGCLDGVSALLASGLSHYEEEMVRVSVPRGVRVRRAPGVVVRQTRRLRDEDRAPSGIPRTRPEVAAVRAALWARSDKQAVLLLTMAVQQGLTTPDRLAAELLRVRRASRRRLVVSVVADLAGGVRSLGEHEFAQLCRARGLPEPTRQALRRGKDGHHYLDVCWEEWGVVVEVDGIHHSWAASVVADALRSNEVTLESALVLRLPLVGLRIAADEFFEQVEQALRSRGCPLPDRAAS